MPDLPYLSSCDRLLDCPSAELFLSSPTSLSASWYCLLFFHRVNIRFSASRKLVRFKPLLGAFEVGRLGRGRDVCSVEIEKALCRESRDGWRDSCGGCSSCRRMCFLTTFSAAGLLGWSSARSPSPCLHLLTFPLCSNVLMCPSPGSLVYPSSGLFACVSAPLRVSPFARVFVGWCSDVLLCSCAPLQAY